MNWLDAARKLNLPLYSVDTRLSIDDAFIGGEGMFMFKLIGSIILALAGLAFAGYVYYVRTSGKKASHSRAHK